VEAGANSRNAEEIKNLGKELYSRIITFNDNMSEVGKGLKKAVNSYNSAVGSMESRLLVSARRFKELGISTDRDIDSPPILEQSVRDIALGNGEKDSGPNGDNN